MNTQGNFQGNFDEQEDVVLDLGRYFRYALSKWYLVAISTVLGVIVAFGVTWLMPDIWQVTSKVVKEKEDTSGGASMLAGLDLGIGGGMDLATINMEYEKGFFMSRGILRKVVDELKLDVAYYDATSLKKRLLYKTSPFVIDFDRNQNGMPLDRTYLVKKLSSTTYELQLDDDEPKEEISWIPFFNKKEFPFGKEVEVNGFKFTIALNEAVIWDTESEYEFRLYSEDAIVREIRDKVSLAALGDKKAGESVLQFTSNGTIPLMEVDLLNTIYKVGEEENIDYKNSRDFKAIEFLDERLTEISDSMRNMASEMHVLRIKNKELSGGSQYVFQKIYELDEERNSIELTLRYLEYLKSYVQDQKEDEILSPNMFGVENKALDQLVEDYITLKVETTTLQTELVENSPIFQLQLKQKREAVVAMEKIILENVTNMTDTYRFKMKQVNRKVNELMKSAETLLSEEKVFTDYQRLFTTNEELYTILLQKKAEASINSASATSDYRVLEYPEISEKPISPKKLINLVIGLLLGAVLPLGLMFVKIVFDNKIQTRDDIEALSSIPVAGVVGKAKRSDVLVVTNSPKGAVSESFRSIRANMKYLVPNKEKVTIMATSTIPGEGKTFFSSNLAASFAQMGKKVLLIGADIRKPRLDDYFNVQGYGLTDYLIGNCESYAAIQKTDVPNLHMIHSGPVPPNPSELLSSDKMSALMADMQEAFDVVMIDTAPIGLVADSFNLLQHVDVMFLMTRQDHTLREMVQKAESHFSDEERKKVNFVLNGVDMENNTYGGTYGSYGYSGGYYVEEEVEPGKRDKAKSFLKKVFS
ncbi:polysaccharide biosynthesis tyrosine autokinase [Algivirga pacifica]|uniref:non-specific protein-tyrosine kinase n=1 Tax=Algivirga pacifica TaxID=1162670 RepID=A0ABP9D4K1_9BACT